MKNKDLILGALALVGAYSLVVWTMNRAKKKKAETKKDDADKMETKELAKVEPISSPPKPKTEVKLEFSGIRGTKFGKPMPSEFWDKHDCVPGPASNGYCNWPSVVRDKPTY